MTTIPRVLVALDSHDRKAWQAAVAFADKICTGSGGAVTSVVLLVHTKNQFSQTDLAGHIGTAQAKALSRGDTLSLPSGAKLRCETIKTLRYLSAKTVIIVYWAEMGILDYVDGLKNLAGIVAVPGFPNEADQWEARWATTVYGRPPKETKRLITDSTVEKALQTLTTVVNLSTGLGHPRDKVHPQDIFRILRAHDHSAEPEAIKSWAITHGWRPKHAAALSDLADKILRQKTKPDLSGVYDAEERYRRWL